MANKYTYLREVARGVTIERPENTSQPPAMISIMCPYGRLLVVMSVACPPAESESGMAEKV